MKATCVNGHEYSEQNRRICTDGKIRCRVCERTRLNLKRQSEYRETCAVKAILYLLNDPSARTNVRITHGIADIVTDTHVYEVKRNFDGHSILEAVGQCLTYAKDLNKIPALAGPAHSKLIEYKELLDGFGIEVLTYNADPSQPKHPKQETNEGDFISLLVPSKFHKWGEPNAAQE